MSVAVGIMQRLWRHLQRTFAREPWWAELWAAVGACLWSVWVILSPAELAGAQQYKMVLAIACEGFWTTSGLVLGVTHLFTVLADRRLARRLICAVAAWWWAVLFLSILHLAPHAPGLALYAIMAAINCSSAIQRVQWRAG